MHATGIQGAATVFVHLADTHERGMLSRCRALGNRLLQS